MTWEQFSFIDLLYYHCGFGLLEGLRSFYTMAVVEGKYFLKLIAMGFLLTELSPDGLDNEAGVCKLSFKLKDRGLLH
jgi:hypothetical protein